MWTNWNHCNYTCNHGTWIVDCTHAYAPLIHTRPPPCTCPCMGHTGQDRGSVHWGQDVDCGGRSCNILRDRSHEYLSPLLQHIWHWTSQLYCTVCLLQMAHSTADLPHCRWLLLCLHTRRNPTRRCTGHRTDCRCHCIVLTSVTVLEWSLFACRHISAQQHHQDQK